MIIQSSKNELNVLVNLVTELWDSLTKEEAKKELTKQLKSPHITHFLAYDKDEAIGFAEVSLRSDYVEGTSTSPVGYLEGIYVKQGKQKQGIGKKLLHACESWAKEKGCHEFASDCELSNTESTLFHLKTGFQEASRIISFTKKI